MIGFQEQWMRRKPLDPSAEKTIFSVLPHANWIIIEYQQEERSSQSTFNFLCLRPNSLPLAFIGLQRRHGFQPWSVFHTFITPIQDLKGNTFARKTFFCVCNLPLQFRIVFAKVTSTRKYPPPPSFFKINKS